MFLKRLIDRIERMSTLRRGPNPGFMILGSGGQIPTRGSDEAAGFDLYAPSGRILDPGIQTMVPLQIASEFRPNWVGQIWDRSGMGKAGVHRLAGVVDSDYAGEWKIILINHTGQPYIINKGDRVAQVVFVPCYCGPVRVITKLRETTRGSSGYGSTGK